LRIGCPQCSTEFELNPPTGRSGKRRRIKFRCTVCGALCNDGDGLGESSGDEPSYSSEPSWNPGSGDAAASAIDAPELPFETAGAYDDSLQKRFEAETAPEAADPALTPFRAEDGHPELDSPEGTLLKQEGKVYHVRNLATIQRWIVERRVLREDLISTGGTRWEPVGHHPDLEIFFQMVERLDELELSSRLPDPGDEHDLKPPVSDETPMGNSLSGAGPALADPLDGDWSEGEPGLMDEGGGEPEDAEDAWFSEHEAEDVDDAQVYASAPSYAYEDSDPSDYLQDDDGIPGFDQALSGDATLWEDDPPPEVEVEPAVVFVSNKAKASDEPAPTLAPVEELQATESAGAHDYPGFADSEPGPTEQLTEEPAEPSLDSLGGEFGDYERAEGVVALQGAPEDDLAWVEDRSGRRLRRFATLAVVLLIVVAGAVFLTWSPQAPEDPALADQPEVPESAEAPEEAPEIVEAPEEAPEVVGAPEEAPEVVEAPEEAPEVVEAPEKAPEVAEAPEKAPEKAPEAVSTREAAPAGRSASAWTEAGWTKMEGGDFRGARAAFVEALAKDPRHADALYGLGYAAQTQGDRSFAIRQYCLAIDNANGRQDILREVPALLNSLGGSCN
jgi:tetratricopeptide (TPR) repeat protein